MGWRNGITLVCILHSSTLVEVCCCVMRITSFECESFSGWGNLTMKYELGPQWLSFPCEDSFHVYVLGTVFVCGTRSEKTKYWAQNLTYFRVSPYAGCTSVALYDVTRMCTVLRIRVQCHSLSLWKCLGAVHFLTLQHVWAYTIRYRIEPCDAPRIWSDVSLIKSK